MEQPNIAMNRSESTYKSRDTISANTFQGPASPNPFRKTRYKNLEDLQATAGEEKLDSYILPEMQQVARSIRSKKISVQKKSDMKDEFD